MSAFDEIREELQKKADLQVICYPQVGHRNIKPTWGYVYVQKKQD